MKSYEIFPKITSGIHAWFRCKKINFKTDKKQSLKRHTQAKHDAPWRKPCRKPKIKTNLPRLPSFGNSCIPDRNIWNQFHFWLIFGYELKPISAAVEFSQESVGRMWKSEGTSWTDSKINSSKYVLWSSWEKNISEIFAHRRAGRITNYFLVFSRRIKHAKKGENYFYLNSPPCFSQINQQIFD